METKSLPSPPLPGLPEFDNLNSGSSVDEDSISPGNTCYVGHKGYFPKTKVIAKRTNSNSTGHSDVSPSLSTTATNDSDNSAAVTMGGALGHSSVTTPPVSTTTATAPFHNDNPGSSGQDLATQLSVLRDQNTKLWQLIKRQHEAILELQQDYDDLLAENQELIRQQNGSRKSSTATTDVTANTGVDASASSAQKQTSSCSQTQSAKLNSFGRGIGGGSTNNAGQTFVSKLISTRTCDFDNSTITEHHPTTGVARSVSPVTSASSIYSEGEDINQKVTFSNNSSNFNTPNLDATLQVGVNTSAQSGVPPPPPPKKTSHRPPPLRLKKSSDMISPVSSPRRSSLNPRRRSVADNRRSSINPHLDVPDSPYAVVTSELDGSAVSIDPSQLDSMTISVCSALLGKVGASLKPNGKEDPVAILSVKDRASDKEMWRLVKDYSQLAVLDNAVRTTCPSTSALANNSNISGGNNHGWMMDAEHLALPKLPDRSLFSSQTPSKVDLRKNLLNQYFTALMSIPTLPTDATACLCKFLASNIIGVPASTSFNKVGFLTKRGRRIRTWKTRFFVLNGPYLDYFDQPEGQHLGTILIYEARIGKPRHSIGDKDGESNSNGAAPDEDYRHAFLIMEKKKNSNSYIRHILCAESDEERDRWVTSLLEYVDVNPVCRLPFDGELGGDSPTDTFGGDYLQAEKKGLVSSVTVVSSSSDEIVAKRPSMIISGPKNGQVITESGWRKLVSTQQQAEERRNKSLFSFKSKEDALTTSSVNTNNNNTNGSIGTPSDLATGGADNGSSISGAGGVPGRLGTPFSGTPGTGHFSSPFFESPFASSGTGSSPSTALAGGIGGADIALNTLLNGYDGLSPNPLVGPTSCPPSSSNQVFGCPLADVVALSNETVGSCVVPSILYRCIELLEKKNAMFEEGVFRLSGSNSVIKELVNRFNQDHDIDLVAIDADVHAVTGLLKRFLREIPVPIIPPGTAPDFNRAMEAEDKETKCRQFREVLHELPKENVDLLHVLCGFLLKIVDNVELNKMTVKNLSIVFSPTLHISTSIFIMLLENYSQMFL